MRLKTFLPNEPKHTETVTCVGWCSPEEVYSCGDDHVLLKWNLITKGAEKVTVLPAEVFPTDLHCLTNKQSSNKIGFDPVLITSSDGRFHLIGKNGRIEKSVEAHRGAILVGRWNSDGSSFLTGGEDGYLKGWSRTGLLRWSLEPLAAENDSVSVYCAAWASDTNSIVHGAGTTLFFRSLTPGAKPFKVKAHDNLILALDWCPNNNLLVSGGEDCRYKVWNSFGHLLFSSSEQNFPVTSLAWSPSGEYFALGSFNTIRLCDKAGWSYHQEKPETGSILALSWSSDETRVAGACSNGHMVLAHIVDRYLEWKHFEVLVPSKRRLVVKNILSDSKDKGVKLEIEESGERIVRVVLNHGHLVALTQRNCYVWDLLRLSNPPISVPVKESSSATLLILAKRHFLLWERNGPILYSYEGRPSCSPQWSTMRADVSVNPDTVSLGSGLFIVRDQFDNKVVHLFDVGCGLSEAGIGKEMKPEISHSLAILKVAANQAQVLKCKSKEETLIAFVDVHGDLHLCDLSYPTPRGSARHVIKLGTMVTTMLWCSEWNILAATTGSSLSVWTYPSVAFSDRRLLKKTILEKESSEFGRGSMMLKSFEGSQIWLRRIDGALTGFSIPPHAAILISHLYSQRWQQALRMCRTIGDAPFAKDYHELMWACLAAAAIHAGQLGPAQEAYASLEEVDRVNHLEYIMKLRHPELCTAEKRLLVGHSTDEIEAALIRSGLIFNAVMINVRFFQWERALKLAKKYKKFVDVVLYSRKDYLRKFQHTETLEIFKNEIKSYEEENGALDRTSKDIKAYIKIEYERENLSRENHT